MTYTFLLVLIFLNLLCLIIKHKSRFVIIISVAIFAVLFGGNNENPDFIPFSQDYSILLNTDSWFGLETISSGDLLLGPFMKIGALLGLEYNDFLLYSSFLALFFIFNFLYNRHNHLIHAMVLLYTMYSFFIDVVQVANFYANICAIFALYKLFDYRKSKQKGDLVLSIFMMVIGIGLHSSIIIFVPVYFLKRSVKIKGLLIISVIFTLFDILLHHILLSGILSLTPLGYYVDALFFYTKNSTGNSGFGFIRYLFLLWLMLSTLALTNNNDSKNNLSYLIKYIILFSPVMAISTITYTRIMRIIAIFYSDFYVNKQVKRKSNKFLLSVFIWVLYTFLFFTEVEMDIFLDVMNNNIYI